MTAFDQDMEDYLSQRKRETEVESSEPVRLHPEVEPYEEQQEKKGFFSRLWKKKEAPAAEEPVEPNREDIKAISKIALHLAKQLPKDKLENFKASSEYSQLKEILRKNGLIR